MCPLIGAVACSGSSSKNIESKLVGTKLSQGAPGHGFGFLLKVHAFNIHWFWFMPSKFILSFWIILVTNLSMVTPDFENCEG